MSTQFVDLLDVEFSVILGRFRGEPRVGVPVVMLRRAFEFFVIMHSSLGGS